MTTDRIRRTVKRIALAFTLTAYVGLPQTVIAAVDNGAVTSGTGASEAIRGALDNVRHRYNQALDYYGLSELYYGETRGICALKLDKPGRAEPLSILYVKSDNTIEYSQVLPKGLAQQLINDRMLIDSYQRVLRADEARAKRLTPEQAGAWHEVRVDGLSHSPYFRRNRRDGAQSTPRSTRYRDDEETARVMNAYYESRVNNSRKNDTKIQPSMRGTQLLEQRAMHGRKPYRHNAPRSGNGLSISGNPRGKLTLTGK